METNLEFLGNLSEASIATLALLVALGVIVLAGYCLRLMDKKGDKDG